MRSFFGVCLGAAAVVAAVWLTRPLLHKWRADTVRIELGVAAAASPRAAAVDDAVLDAIDAGAFGEELRLRLARPRQTVRLQPFWMDACEVRQIDFERYANWTAAQAAAAPANSAPAAARPVSISTGHRIAGVLNSPATGVDFAAAGGYCAAAGGRLPFAEEFAAAAGGAAGRLYAWGDEFTAAIAAGIWPYRDAWRNAARPCAAFSPAASPDGVHDLTGNAMEWSAGRRAESAAVRRPAAHGAPAVRARGRALYALNAAWLPIPPQTRSHHLGFRCVYEAAPPPQYPWGGLRKPPRPVPGGAYPIGLPAEARIARLATVTPRAHLHKLRGWRTAAGQPARVVRIGRCEVSRGEYQKFLADPLARTGWFANTQEPADATYIPDDWDRQRLLPELPVTGISWWAADAFARWAGGRLPRADTWRLVAAGREARIYPWGDNYDSAAAVTADLPRPGLRACAAGGRDVTAGGVRHMGGNVSEWTRSISARGGAYAMWVMGGSWQLPGAETARGSFGRLTPLQHKSPAIGLRVVYD